MTGQSTVTGTIAAYAGGSITATFVSQGGGSPAVTTVSGNIASNGTFSLLAWDNTNALYAPSQTNFQIQVGESTFYNAKTTVAGSSQNISSIFSGAPTPPGGGAVSSVFTRTGAVVAQAGDYTFDQIGSGTNLGHGLVAGTGCVMSTAGTGVINANELNGGSIPTSQTYVGTNSSGQIVAAATPGSGAMVLLETETASSSATLTFSSWYSAAYDTYQIEIVNLVPTTTNGYMYMQMSGDNGNNYGYAGFNMVSNATSSFGANGSVNQLLITGSPGNINANAAEGVVGTIMLYSPASLTLNKRVRSHVAYSDNSNEQFLVEQTGNYKPGTIAAVTSFTLTNSAGTWASGIVRVYGIAK